MSGTATASDRPAGILETFREMPRYTRYALFGVMVNQFGAFLQAYLVLYLINRGFSAADAGIALGAYAIGSMVGTTVGGWFHDRLGPRLTIAGAVAAASLLTFSVTLLSSLQLIVVAVFLAGVMTLVSRPAVAALLLKSMPEGRRVMVQAMYRTALNAGGIGGPLIAAGLSTIDWNLVFYVDAAAAMCYCAIAFSVLPRGQIRTAEEEANPAGKVGYLTMLRDARFVGFLAVMLGNGMVHVQAIAVLPLMLHDAGYPTIAYGAALTAATAMIVTCELLVVKVTQRWVAWVAVTAGWLMLVVGSGSYGLFGVAGLAIVIGGIMLGALGQITGGAQAFSHPARVAPPEALGRYIGSMYSMFYLGYTLGPIIGVALWLALGTTFWFVVFGFGLLVAVLLVWSMTGPGRTPAPGPAPATTTATTTAAGSGGASVRKDDD